MRDAFSVAQLPSGTVTFLFSDVEGSTRVLRELGAAAYEQALREHRAALRAIFVACGGVEVDTQGDAFFVVFARSADALRAAGRVADALRDGLIRVRIGIHTGEPLLSEEGYVGLDVHRAARIAAVGHGGQVLVSQTTRDLVPEAELRDLGEHRLKDLARPERLFQLGEGEFPPLRSLNRASLPVTGGPLLGRERELVEIAQLIRGGQRLVTLSGPGGSGKTRLAIQVAAELVEDYPDGVFFVALAPLRDPALVAGAAATAMGLSADDDLVAALLSRRALLVLDNAEHLDVAGFVVRLLDAARRVVVLVTSRAPLHLALEREVLVEPLVTQAAVELFVARAAAVGQQVMPDETVVRICRRLDCLPLAVELAAGRTKLLTPGALLDRLERALPLLTGGARDAPDRQRTLRATIEWSYELLDESGQQSFRSLSVFQGSFSAEAAAMVAETDLDDIATLIDHNLLKRVGDDRFLMLETIREYAYEQLEDAQEARQLRNRHGRWYLDKLREFSPVLRGPRTRALLSWYDAETPNTWLALEELRSVDLDAALALADELGPYWAARGRMREGRAWLFDALADAGPATIERARALARVADLSVRLGDLVHGQTVARDAAALGRTVGDDLATARALHELARIHYSRHETDAAAEIARDAVAAATRIDAWFPGMHARNMLALVLIRKQQFDEARELLEQNIRVCHEHGDTMNIAVAHENLGVLAFCEGHYAEARERGRAAVGTYRDLGNLASAPNALANLAVAAVADGDESDGLRCATEALTLALEAGMGREALSTVATLTVAARRVNPAAAARLWSAALTHLEQNGSALDPFHSAQLEPLINSIAEHIGRTAFDRALADGRRLTEDETLELAFDFAQQAAQTTRAPHAATSSPQA